MTKEKVETNNSDGLGTILRVAVVVSLIGTALIFLLVWGAEGQQPIEIMGRQKSIAYPQTTGGFTVPYYGAQYNAGADSKRIVELLEAMHAEQQRTNQLLELAIGEQPQSIEQRLDIQQVAGTHCAGCHTPSKSKEKGGGFVLFANDEGKALRFLSTRELNRVKEAVQSGAMPPNGKLSQAEKSAFTSE